MYRQRKEQKKELIYLSLKKKHWEESDRDYTKKTFALEFGGDY